MKKVFEFHDCDAADEVGKSFNAFELDGQVKGVGFFGAYSLVCDVFEVEL